VQSAGENYGCAPPIFLTIKVQLVVLVSAFVMVSTVWSVSFSLFFYSRCPRAQPFVKVEEARAPVPYGVTACGLINKESCDKLKRTYDKWNLGMDKLRKILTFFVNRAPGVTI